MSKLLVRATLGSLATLGIGVALAQEPPPAECQENGRSRGHVQVCEVRELTSPATGSLSIVDRTIGDISVRAWDRDEVHVRAVVRATARDLEAAREIAASVVISEGNRLRASGPEWRGNQRWGNQGWGNESWTVDVDFPSAELLLAPITTSGRLGRRISTTLGDGGPLVRVETTGGAIRIGPY